MIQCKAIYAKSLILFIGFKNSVFVVVFFHRKKKKKKKKKKKIANYAKFDRVCALEVDIQ